MEKKNAIVLAMFGTTSETALPGLLTVYRQVTAAFPETVVRLAFTSNIIRSIWQKRAADPEYRKTHPEIPPSIYDIQGPLAAIAGLQDKGHKSIVVQAVHIAPAEEFHDLCRYVQALASIKTMKPRWMPFQHLTIGRPILGSYSQKHPYGEDILQTAKALEEDVILARQKEAVLLYMGHGNTLFPSGGLYTELAATMKKLYPDTKVFVGTIGGYPSLDDILNELKREAAARILLKPFLIVAGEHAKNDMAGDQPDSWENRLKKEGFEVMPVIRGLGEQQAFSRLFVRHINDAAEDAGIELS